MQLRYCLDGVKILFRLGVGGWVGRIRLTSAKVLVEVEAKLGNTAVKAITFEPLHTAIASALFYRLV